MQLEKCFVKVLESLPEQPIIKDIDVLFNPAYKVDVMKLLSSAYKQKQFSLVWPGSYADGKLTYSEEGYPDYRVYEINDYECRQEREKKRHHVVTEEIKEHQSSVVHGF